MTRGVVLGLTLDEIADRAVALGSPGFAVGYYLLKEHNGGKDPTAPDPFDRWPFKGHDGQEHEACTCDCIGGACWCGGFDRYQPVRFAHIAGYDGWINTDSMLIDATGPAKCFVVLPRPVRGCFLVAPTGAPGFLKCGHIITLHTIPEDFDFDDIESWKKMLGTDVALMGSNRANTTHDATWWFSARNHGAKFVQSIMTP